jgi:hypothetical protein
MDIDGHFGCITKFVKTKLLKIKSIGVLYCAGTSLGNVVVWTLLELIRMHTFLSFRVVRVGQCEPAPTLIPSPSLVGIFHSGNVKFGLKTPWTFRQDYTFYHG